MPPARALCSAPAGINKHKRPAGNSIVVSSDLLVGCFLLATLEVQGAGSDSSWLQGYAQLAGACKAYSGVHVALAISCACLDLVTVLSASVSEQMRGPSSVKLGPSRAAEPVSRDSLLYERARLPRQTMLLRM